MPPERETHYANTAADVPDVSYAWSGDVAIAYQVVGEGSDDLVVLPVLANIDTLWHARRASRRSPAGLVPDGG